MTGPSTTAKPNSRRDRILSYTLVEVLITLVFIAAAYGVMASDQGNATIAAQRTTIEELEQERNSLRAERDKLDRWIRRLWQALRPDTQFPANPDEIDDVISQIEAKGQQIRQVMNAAPGLPVCSVGPQRLFQITTRADGSLAVVLTHGTASEDQAAASISGAAAMDGKSYSLEEFGAAAGEVNSWALSQSPSCRLRVDISPVPTDHNNTAMFVRQREAITRYFYVRQLF